MHYSFMRKIRLAFIDSDLLYRGAIYKGRFDCIHIAHDSPVCRLLKYDIYQLYYILELDFF
jgi:hypothetical protein